MDINGHKIHFMVGLLGRPDKGEYLAGHHGNGVDIHGILVMRYGDVICQCTGAKDTWCENSAQIMGDRGYIRVTPCSNNLQEARLVRKGTGDLTVKVDGDQWFYEVQELARLVEQKDYETCYRNLDNTLEVVRILEKCRGN